MPAKDLTWELTKKKFSSDAASNIMKKWLDDLLKKSSVDMTRVFGTNESIPTNGKKYVLAVNASEFTKIKRVLTKTNGAPTISNTAKYDLYWSPIKNDEYELLLVEIKTNKNIIKIHITTTGLKPHDPNAKPGVKKDSLTINTQQQELITLGIFKAVLDKKTPDWNSFEEMYDDKKSGLQKIHSGLKIINYKNNDWWKHFDLQFNELLISAKKGSGLKTGHYEVYNRDGTGVSTNHNFMDWISALVTKGTNGVLDQKEIAKFAKKDSWNPADIWLIDTTGGAYDKVKTELASATTIAKINAIMINAFNKRIIKGISLKKNRGGKGQLMWEEVNLYATPKKQKLPVIKIKTIEFDPHYNSGTKSFSSVTSAIILTDGQTKFKLSFRSNQSKMKDITYEFSEEGMPAQLGKIPKDRFETSLSNMNISGITSYPKLDDHHTFNKTHWNKVYSVVGSFLNKYNWKISSGSRSNLKYKMSYNDFKKQTQKERGRDFVVTKELYKKKLETKTEENKNIAWKNFVDNMEESWQGGKKKGNSVMMQMADFIYLLALIEKKLKTTGFNQFMTDIFYWAQKKGQKWEFGPFAKSY